jgi:hypothetical protein
MTPELGESERAIVQRCIDVAHICAQEFREKAATVNITSLSRALNEMGAMDCELVASRIYREMLQPFEVKNEV